ncbi:hypothetical protein FE257_001833 [Aspergillus nanangensis]|uniref:Fumarylacetoacetase-like C-terminal domain-containing protein n=1 Tax=Aspergillus nanangensis TaxID=2582783 RepID=A0AAD4CDP0_ASPNN|nr:hypothetical protein FE257_001833 [Aspergillus nanangensis]
MSWSRYIRFRDDDGMLREGEPQVGSADELLTLLNTGELYAREISSNGLFEGKLEDRMFRVREVIGPLEPADVPIIRNWAEHRPTTHRYSSSRRIVTGWDSSIPIPKIAQKDQMDFEVELAILIGADGKDIPAENALDYVAGYLVANDVSARAWQRDPHYARECATVVLWEGIRWLCPGGPNDSFAQGAADNLSLETTVNGTVCQQANTGDCVFGMREIVAFERPVGVIFGSANPQWLEDGDVVEVSISGIGSIRNRMNFL